MKLALGAIAFVLAVAGATFGGSLLWTELRQQGPPPPAPTTAPSIDTPAPLPRSDSSGPPTPQPDPTPPPTPTFLPPDSTPTPAPTPTSPPAPTATSRPRPSPTATATPSPSPTEAVEPASADDVPVSPEYCGGATAEITSLDKAGKPEVITVTGSGNLTRWFLISVTGMQRFDFPDGFILDGDVRVLSGDDTAPDTVSQLFWTTRNVWNNSLDDDAQLYDCAGVLVHSFDDGA